MTAFTYMDFPVHPQPSIYETTLAGGEVEPAGPVITHTDIELILTRNRWNYADANLCVWHDMHEAGWVDHPDGMLVPPKPKPSRNARKPRTTGKS